MANIDNLEIQITANADSAASAINRLSSGCDRLHTSASSAASGTRELADGAEKAGTATHKAGAETGSAEPAVRRFGRSAEEAGKNAKKGTAGISDFWNALKRVAYYRFIRSIIKEITSAFKEGIKNLYHWSSAIDGNFAKSMDRLATSTQYLKNSLGAMLAPIIERLTPVIEWIIDRIVDVINWINKLFAALSGSQTYTVAKKVAAVWDDSSTKTAKNAKKTADEMKKTILAFDEINKLVKPTDSSGSGGRSSGKKQPNYAAMFEERKLDGWMSKLSAFINKFNLGVPAVLGGILAGWIAIKAAIKAVAKLSLGWLKDMAGKTIDIAVSLVRKGWTTIKNWALSFGQAVVDCFVSIKTKALELWVRFAEAWSALNPVLKVGIVTSVTAAALWLAYKAAWALIPDKMLEIEAAIKTSASVLLEKLRNAWNSLGSVSLSVQVAISTAAAVLWNGLRSAWETACSVGLSVAVKLSTTADQLWQGLKSAWANGVAKVLSVSISSKQSEPAKTGASDIIEAPKGLGVGALVASIVIATPWKDIASSLSKLWGKATESVGGALAFSVMPSYDMDEHLKFKKKLNEQVSTIHPIVQVFMGIAGASSGIANNISASVKEWRLKVKSALSAASGTPDLSLTVDINGRPGEGFKRSVGSLSGTNSYSLDPAIQQNIDRTPLVVPVDAKTMWGKTANSAISYLGLNSLVANISAYLKQTWGRGANGAINSLGLGNLWTTIAVYLEPKTKEIKVASGGGGTWRLYTKANGGVLSNGAWSDIPQYAGGTYNAMHGSLFWAGERGAEVVGHANGRTEVLNRSQIASAIYSAVNAAMAPASANFAAAASNMANTEAGYNMDGLADMVRQGVEGALERQREILRQQTEYLRQINDKEFKAEVTTASINSAQTRFNRRAGVTVVPVG